MKQILSFALIVFILSGCLKSENNNTTTCTPKTVASEMPAMKAYATANNLTVTEDPSGVLYQVIDLGNGAVPAANSNITVTYVGKLLNGAQFDQAITPVSFPLSGLIQGWQIGIPKIKSGGKINLIIPSSLAYGCDPRWGVVANQPLYFEISLTDVK